MRERDRETDIQAVRMIDSRIVDRQTERQSDRERVAEMQRDRWRQLWRGIKTQTKIKTEKIECDSWTERQINKYKMRDKER